MIACRGYAHFDTYGDENAIARNTIIFQTWKNKEKKQVEGEESRLERRRVTYRY